MSIGEEMTREDVENTKMTFHAVRVGGPKEKRLRRVELMGEHTPKPLHWLKVTLSSDQAAMDLDRLTAVFEEIGDVGDVYRPTNFETQAFREFIMVGFFSAKSITPAVRRLNGIEVDGEKIVVEAAKPWFIGLYPKRHGYVIGGGH